MIEVLWSSSSTSLTNHVVLDGVCERVAMRMKQRPDAITEESGSVVMALLATCLEEDDSLPRWRTLGFVWYGMWLQIATRFPPMRLDTADGALSIAAQLPTFSTSVGASTALRLVLVVTSQCEERTAGVSNISASSEAQRASSVRPLMGPAYQDPETTLLVIAICRSQNHHQGELRMLSVSTDVGVRCDLCAGLNGVVKEYVYVHCPLCHYNLCRMCAKRELS